MTVAIVTVGRLGALRLSLASIGGQLTGAAILDVVWPLEGQHLTPLKAVGAFVAFVAVALASGVRSRAGPVTPLTGGTVGRGARWNRTTDLTLIRGAL